MGFIVTECGGFRVPMAEKAGLWMFRGRLGGGWVFLGVVVLGRRYRHSFVFTTEGPTRGPRFLKSKFKQVSHPAPSTYLRVPTARGTSEPGYTYPPPDQRPPNEGKVSGPMGCLLCRVFP